jgi:hypothetical protein
MNKPELLTKPLQDAFTVSTTVMLGQGFKGIRYILIENKKYIDGIFYFEDDDCNYIDKFADKLESAHINSLINDFDFITGDTEFILLRKYKRDDTNSDFINKIKNG